MVMKMYEDTEEQWGVVESLYRETGRNFVDRVINNIEYDIKKK